MTSKIHKYTRSDSIDTLKPDVAKVQLCKVFFLITLLVADLEYLTLSGVEHS